MRITIATKRNEAIVIDLGYETEFHSCMDYITITKEYYDNNGNVCHANHIKGFFRQWKFRRNPFKRLISFVK